MPETHRNPWRGPLLGSAVSLALVLAALGGWLLGRAHSERSGGPPVLFTAPAYRNLTNQNGQKVSSADFRGKVRVVTFLFPYCNTFCPIIAAHLVGFEHLLQADGLADSVQVVAFDVDPAGTGPKEMRGFLKEYGWDPQNTHWQYLTGTPKQIRTIVTGGYHVDYQKVADTGPDPDPKTQAALLDGDTPQPYVANPLADKANVKYDITHENVLMLVDPEGRVRVIHAQADAVSQWELLKEVKAIQDSR
ncbi:MAG TPA: SCO family protein [Acetobacteraceae bacterium]|nr:SCO family protein [Acetobacteraceae bacterium]